MYKRIASKLGCNYVWGVANYTFGVVNGAFLAGVLAGVLHH